MRVLIINPYAVWTPHFETDLEIMQRHLDDGDEVTYLTCDARLPTCEANRAHDLSTCIHCTGRQKTGLRLLSRRVQTRPLIHLTAAQQAELRAMQTEFTDVEQLKMYWVDNFDLGWGALSSLVGSTRDPIPDLSDVTNLRILKDLLRPALAVYRSVRNYLHQERIDTAYVFNGRLALVRAAFRACQAEAVTCYTHERGCNFGHFDLYDNSLPHDIGLNEQRMMRLWHSAPEAQRQQLGAQYYEDRAQGKRQSWISFVDQQSLGMLPPGWSPERRNIAIFTSSEDEFVSIGDMWVNPLYKTQLTGLQQIISDMQEHSDCHLYIRIHPNLKGVRVPYAQEMLALAAPNITVVSPESPVSTYALMWQADRVLTFGSTAGIEATFWRRPSILAGPSFYRNLGATRNPKSHSEVIQLLTAETLAPSAREGALIYGFYMQTHGEPFRYFEGTDVWDGQFKGVSVRPPDLWARAAVRINGTHPRLNKIAGKFGKQLIHKALR